MAKKQGPGNVRGLLTEMKDASDLMIDLAYSSLLFENEEIAKQVKKLEGEMDGLMYRIRALSTISVRNLENANKISGILQIAHATEDISNATGDLADIVLRGIDVHPVIKDALKKANEKIALIELDEISKITKKKLSELDLPSRVGIWVLAAKRGDSWIVPPTPETELKVGDKLIVRNHQEGMDIFCKMAGVAVRDWSVRRKYRRLKKSLANMRDTGCLMVDMAYSSVLFKSREVAEEVRELEEKFDKLNYDTWKEVLKAAGREKDVTRLNSVLQIVKSIERISDAADLIADVVLRGVEIHPVFEQALKESDERIVRVNVSEGSVLANQTLEKLDHLGWRGAYPMMIKRGEHYIFKPTKKTIVHPGDRLIIRGSERGVKQLEKAGKGKEELSASS